MGFIVDGPRGLEDVERMGGEKVVVDHFSDFEGEDGVGT